ncbi:MAG TPA: CpaD family pilus assembly protein [Rhizomicrobium sp.]|jgi:pilus assembly protein CpaD|nr:CpaD family pilus assembly protein [Rhizomicrobium sp.]
MREKVPNPFRGLCLSAVLLAGSCSTQFSKDPDNFDDPIVNHPITVEPSYQSLKLSSSTAGMDAADREKLDAFVTEYRMHGNGKISIAVPGGPGMQQAVTMLADRINELGISRDRILVASTASAQIEVNYISYQARTNACGDWSENLSYTADNTTAGNLGCANQHNLAAMVADPRDLLGPRAMDGADAVRRQTVIGNYETGKVTGADKSADQKATISDVGH